MPTDVILLPAAATSREREALERLYEKAVRVGQLESYLATMREVHARLVDDNLSAMGLSKWLSERISAGLDDAARARQ